MVNLHNETATRWRPTWDASTKRAGKYVSFFIFVVVLTFVLILRTPLQDMRWEALWEYREFLLRSLAASWILMLLSFLASTIPATVLAFCRISRHFWLRYPSIGIIEGIRIIPELMIIFWIFFTVPIVVGQSLNKFVAGFVALTVINSAYLSEAIRAGISSVPRGLSLAAVGSGMTSIQVRLLVVLPIALRNMLPELRNRAISLFKLTSLLYVIGVAEFFNGLVQVNNRELAPFATMITAGVVYFCCAYVIELVTRYFEAPRRR